MSIAATLQNYLDQKHIDYDLITHPATASSVHTAGVCALALDRVAKGVVLRADAGYVLIVLPASYRLRRADLKETVGRNYAFATEHELDQLFPDCAHGAVPPFGECYGLDVLVEDSVHDQPDLYLEGGDHTTLVHMSQAQFAKLTANARHGCFATRA